MKKIFLFIFILSSILGFSQSKKKVNAKSHFKLTITAKGLENAPCLFAYYFGENKYKIDSLNFNTKGVATYLDTAEKVKGGIYMLIFPTKGNNYVEFLVSNKENLDLIVDTSNFAKLEYGNSLDNKLFYEEISFSNPIRKEMMELRNTYKSETSESKKKEIEEKSKVLEKKIDTKRKELMAKCPTCLYTKLMNLMQEVEVSDSIKKKFGKLDTSVGYYNYYKKSFWEKVDFNDDRLLQTPVFEPKLKYYFDKIISKHPDTIIKEIDMLIDKVSDPNSMMKRFLIGTFYNEYANSKIMGQDAVYVHMVKNYYAKNKTPWTDSATIKKMIDEASDIEPLLLGKTAPNFAAFDTTLKNYKKLYDVKTEYKLLAFWNPDCGHCKKEIPKLDSIYPELLKRNCDVFGVSTIVDKDNNIQDWKDFINKHNLKFPNYADPKHQMNPLFILLYHIKGTPEYFMLDKDNKIIAKKISPEQLVDFLDNYKKMLKETNK